MESYDKYEECDHNYWWPSSNFIIIIPWINIHKQTSTSYSSAKIFNNLECAETYLIKRDVGMVYENGKSDNWGSTKSSIKDTYASVSDGLWKIVGKLTNDRFYDEVRMNVNTTMNAESWKTSRLELMWEKVMTQYILSQRTHDIVNNRRLDDLM